MKIIQLYHENKKTLCKSSVKMGPQKLAPTTSHQISVTTNFASPNYKLSNFSLEYAHLSGHCQFSLIPESHAHTVTFGGH